ncbi:fasciclin domain-containing protein [Dokdonia sinensis]|uniref:Fasciclin domain-containing protein n=1 Tax=Dokdonia sinensis TaxID=2479847 RepID=A0A3M0GG76_9FLAO|nr:fasciclin domain-containing protein [Dokdonia sinensis]RMB63935.1 fasciclin domain-containing protein [Dokdonia sinensis]
MKTLFKISKMAVMALTLVVATSCGDDDDNGNIITPEQNTIADFVIENENYSLLEEALVRTGLDATLDASGTFTVFAPDNAAFTAFLNGAQLEDVDNDVLTQVLLNHVLDIEAPSTSLTTGYVKNLATEASTGANLDMYIDTTSGVVINGQSTVVSANIETDNGIIHAVNTVIELPTIVTFATTNPALSSLVGALTAGGNTTFTDLLGNSELDFTVFAPTNDAFGAFTNPASNDLAQILSNHVITGTVALSSGLVNGYVNTEAVFNEEDDAKLSLYVNTDDGVVLNGASTVAQADIVASNGVVHVVDTVIDLPTVVTFATADPTFDTLEAALTADPAFTFVSTLQTANGTSPAPFTVFAPTNDAFGNLLTDLGISGLDEIDSDTLAATLSLHVIAGANVRAEDLENGVVTSLGGDITIDADNTAVIDPDGGANPIVVTNVQAANGVVHAVSRVLRDL